MNPSSHQLISSSAHPVKIGSREYNGYTMSFQGGVYPMPIDDLTAFKKYWNA